MAAGDGSGGWWRGARSIGVGLAALCVAVVVVTFATSTFADSAFRQVASLDVDGDLADIPVLGNAVDEGTFPSPADMPISAELHAREPIIQTVVPSGPAEELVAATVAEDHLFPSLEERMRAFAELARAKARLPREVRDEVGSGLLGLWLSGEDVRFSDWWRRFWQAAEARARRPKAQDDSGFVAAR